MSEEDMEHMLFKCPYSKSIWDQLENTYKYSNQPPNDYTLHKWIKTQCQSKAQFNGYLNKADAIPFILWHIWLHRNDIIFKNKNNPLQLGHVVSSTI